MSEVPKKPGAAKSRKAVYPRTVAFENGRVRVALRKDGKFALAWMEEGGTKKTTITSEAKVLEFAEKKARLLNAGTAVVWVSPAGRYAACRAHVTTG